MNFDFELDFHDIIVKKSLFKEGLGTKHRRKGRKT